MTVFRLILALFVAATLATASLAEERKPRFANDILRETFGFSADTPSDVPLAQLQQGCPARDCIPSIDHPKFVGAADAKFMDDDDLVLAVDHAGVVRAYPTFILNHHEIVNDVIAGTPVAITWCPLCGSGLAFERVLDGSAVEFGVSGVLNESDLVMYDRRSNSLWQQISARAFIGPCRGRTLTAFPVAMTTWGEWKAAHPATEVLSTDTGSGADYSEKSPYASYESSDRVMFPVSHVSQLARPKEVVYGLRLAKGAFAVTEALLRAKGSVDIEHQGELLHWRRNAAGQVTVTVGADPQPLPTHRMYWFSWYTFNPDTRLHSAAPATRSEAAK